MPIGKYLPILARRIRVILMIAALTVASTALFSLVQTPVYRSTVVMNVWPARLDWSLQNTILGLLTNYTGTIQSRDVAQQAIDRLQLDLVPELLQEKLEVEADELTFVISVSADDYDPLLARDMAQAVADVFIEGIDADMVDQNRENRVEIRVRDSALPGTMHKPNWDLNLLAGLVFGLLGGAIVALVLDWLESDILHTARDVQERTGIAVLGTIPK